MIDEDSPSREFDDNDSTDRCNITYTIYESYNDDTYDDKDNQQSTISSPLTHTDDYHRDKGKLKTDTFLSPEENILLLTESEDSLQYIPGGNKENVFFIVDNSTNFEKKADKV